MEYIIVFLPLLGSIISGFFGNRIGVKRCQLFTSLFVIISAIDFAATVNTSSA